MTRNEACNHTQWSSFKKAIKVQPSRYRRSFLTSGFLPASLSVPCLFDPNAFICRTTGGFIDRHPPVPKRAERYLNSTINLGASEERYVEGNSLEISHVSEHMACNA